jgi:predicted lipoprotein with Yx(FWY)xxD motif
VRRTGLLPLISIIAAGLLGGCGSSNSNSGTPSKSAGNTTSAAGGYSAGAYSHPASTPSSSAKSALIATKHSKLGTILAVGPKKLTVYLFEADHGSASACSAACAAVWPPVTGSAKAIAGAMSDELGTITRSDGTKQVTYKGHPLYTFVKDKDDGDAYGEGAKAFGAEWYAIAPSGQKVDKS